MTAGRRRTGWDGVTVVMVTALAGCAGRPAAVRFAATPAVWVVDDRRDVPVPPDERSVVPDLYDYDAVFHRRITRALELPRPQPALGVNALDEVPDSTWFTNRIGVRTVTPDEIRTGPLVHDSPEQHRPWTIRSTKIGGTSFGLIIKDARGDRYLIKFDTRGFPELETGAHVIANRLLWACGYNVPEDRIVHFRREDLVISPDTRVVSPFGDSRPFDRAELDRQLARLEVAPDGSIRGLASRWLDGKPLGGHPDEGVRDDDPNDRIRHELRRDLRGLHPIFAWLDHIDVKEGNTLDMWTADATAPHRHYVVHYLIDFGRSLGVGATLGSQRRSGFTYAIDFYEIGKSLLSLGLADRPWEHRRPAELRGVGLYAADPYDPARWKPAYPAYVPFLAADDADRLWGARLVMRFTRAQLHAAVEAGQLSDPHAVEYLTDMLVERQRATASYWFNRLDPLDHFAIEVGPAGPSLTFDDLALVYRLRDDAATTRYLVTALDRDGHPIAATVAGRADPGGHASVGTIALASDRDGYTMLRITTTRPGTRPPTVVHVVRDPGSQPRVIGIWRGPSR